MHFAHIDQIQPGRRLPYLVLRSVRDGGAMRSPRAQHLPIRSAVERLRTVVVSPGRPERRTATVPLPIDDLTAELGRERDRLHELRSTVGGLVASYRLLQERQVELTPAARSRLEHLHDAELGRLERLLADQDRSPQGPVDLEAAIDPFVETLLLRGHEITWSGTALRAWGCQDDVAQVVHVLLENAVRHAYGDQVEVAVQRRGDHVEVLVRDHGPGIAPEVRHDLFVRGVRRAGSPGHGIGLDIAHRLADQMGAVLRLDPGDADRPGATFVLSLLAMPEAVSEQGLVG